MWVQLLPSSWSELRREPLLAFRNYVSCGSNGVCEIWITSGTRTQASANPCGTRAISVGRSSSVLGAEVKSWGNLGSGIELPGAICKRNAYLTYSEVAAKIISRDT